MKASDIIRELFNRLPFYTDKFTTNLSVSSLTRSGSTVTAVTSTVHNLVTGNYAHINGALTPYSISSLVKDIDGLSYVQYAQQTNLALRNTSIFEIGTTVGIATTINPHDLTEGGKPYVNIQGADQSEYNGQHYLLKVIDKYNFVFSILGEPVSPATGSIFLTEDRLTGYNGWHEVTLVDPNTFTYSISFTPESPALGTIKASTKPRISGALNSELVLLSYTEQKYTDLWAFVVLGGGVSNKSRQTSSDAIGVHGKGEAYRQFYLQPFSVFVVIPTTGSISGRQEIDLISDLIRPFCKSLLGVRFPTDFTADAYSPVELSGDSFFSFDNAFYVHEFRFETSSWLTYDDTIDPDLNVALREIDINYYNGTNINAGPIMESKNEFGEQNED